MTIELKANMRVGDYSLLKTLGKDVVGQIYLAEHQYLKKQFTLRVFAQQWVDLPRWDEVFETKISQYVRVESPFVEKIINAGKSEGKYFIATECTVGNAGEPYSLMQYIRAMKSPLNIDQAYTLILNIAEGLEAIHAVKSSSESLCHGALSPSTILIGSEKEEIEVKICDMGLSTLCGPIAYIQRNIDQMLNMPSSTGTESYSSATLALFDELYTCMSPELKVNPIAQSSVSDIYSLGVVGFIILYHHLPYGLNSGLCELDSSFYPLELFIHECMHLDPQKRPIKPSERLKVLMEQEFQSSNHDEKILEPALSKSILHRPSIDQDPAAQFSHQPVVSQYKPEKHAIADVAPILSDMVVIEGGQFYRGCNSSARDERPRHQIQLDSFALDVNPVTNDQYMRFLEAMGGEKDANHNDLIVLKESRIKKIAGKLSIEAGYNHHPVVGVTWYGAFAYCQWVGKRLPTEAEWEVASMGGILDCLYPTGETIEKSKANFFNSDTVRVKSYPPNPFGLYDMAGNVYEWCQDWYGYNYYEVSQQEPDCPKGPVQGVYRVLRGGCWKSLERDLLCAQRHRNKPGMSNSTYGFRCASDVKEDRK